MAVRPPDLTYGLDERPPWHRLTVLGFQYALLITVYLIIVVIVARAAKASADVIHSLVSLGLIAAGIATVLQAYPGRAFGSGFLAPPVYSAIYLGPAILAANAGGLPAVAGMTIFAGLIEIVLSRLLFRLRVVFQPLISGFTVLIVGLQLGLVGIAHTLDVPDENTPEFASHVAVALITLSACVALSIWGRGIWRLVSTVIGIAAGVIAAIFVGLINRTSMTTLGDAPWVAIPDRLFLSYSFEANLLPVFLAAGLAATLRTIGVVTTCQRLNDAAWKRPDLANIQRGVTADGLGCLAGGILGVPGMSVAPSLVGVSSATGATSRVIAYCAGAFLVAFAFVPKVGAAIISLPLEIAGAVLVFTASFMISSGLQIMTARSLDVRATFAVGIALLLGLLTQVEPGYFQHLPGPLRAISADMMTLSLVVAIGLTLLFRIGIRRKEAIAWRASDASFADFDAFLSKQAKAWKLDSDLVERCRSTVEALVGHLKDAHLLAEPVSINASYDGIDLRVDLRYRGGVLVVATPEKGHAQLHEEAPAGAGLGSFALGLHADRRDVASVGDQVTIRLWFNA